MANITVNKWLTILNSASNISGEIREEIYKLVGADFKDIKLQEYIKSSLETFQFNSIIKQQIKKELD